MSRKGRTLDIAWTAGRLAGRRLLKRAEGARDAELGELLTGQLDEMKGLAMKLGQIVSYMDVPLPQAAQQKLARLQSGIEGMSEEATRAALSKHLGEGFVERFDELSLTPIAAASIGQVHRARYQGQDIALKVQYPEVATSFVNDLSAVNKIAGLASLASAVDGKRIVTELAARLAEECDYEREARFQRAFAQAFAGYNGIHIPAVVDELTTKQTLAKSWVVGADFERACALPQEIRDEISRTLVRFSYRSLLQLAAIQADPHPGNFLFGDDGTVTFLDFGCVRTFEPHFVQTLRRMILAIDAKDLDEFRAATIDLKLAPRPEKFDFAHQFRMMEHLHRPLLAPSFEFTREFIKEGMDYNGPTNPNARHMGMPPEYIWVARLQWGLWSLLRRLGARASLRDILDDVIKSPITPLLGK